MFVSLYQNKLAQLLAQTKALQTTAIAVAESAK